MSGITNFFGCEINTTLNPPGSGERLETLLVMKPKPCPYPLIRIGGTGDGAYLVPDDLAGITACFSPGVNNAKDFEDHLTDDYGITCHMCDKSSDPEKFRTPLKTGLQTFKKSWLDVAPAEDCISLERWVGELSPNPEDDLLLQIDIEGAEYRNFLQTPAATLNRFRIIVVEFHGLGKILDPDIFRGVFQPLFDTLDALFICVHAHPNNCCGDFQIPDSDLNMPHVHELTLLRRDRINAAGRQFFPPMLPHPQDIARNVGHNPPLFLSAAWMDGPRAPESRIKMLEIELGDLRQRQADAQAALAALAATYALAQQAYLDILNSARNAPPDGPELTDVALAKPFTLSSAYGHFPKTGTVRRAEPFFFHTGLGAGQSITVDLADAYCIWTIRIRNRTDQCHGRANYLFYVLRDAAGRAANPAYPLSVENDFLAARCLACETQLPGLQARYIEIFSTAVTALHFSGLEIFATSLAGA